MRAMKWWLEHKKDVKRAKRERAIAAADRARAETKTATELWNAEDAGAREYWLANDIPSLGPASPAPDKITREYLISKYGDNIAAYDVWRGPRRDRDRDGRQQAIRVDAFAWNKEREKRP